MFLGIRKKYWAFLGVTLLLAGMMVFLQASPWFTIKTVNASGPYAETARQVADRCLTGTQNLFRFHKPDLVQQMMTEKHIAKVALSVRPFNGLKATVNCFEPVALVMGENLFGLDYFCRLLPYDSAWEKVDLPIMTGLPEAMLFTSPGDYRIANVVAGLVAIKNEIPDLFRQIAEIDFSDNVYVSVYLTTGNNRYLAGACDFTAQLIKLDAVSRTVARSDDGSYNLMYDGVVIKQN